ncbi:nSTAND1 domain-containing NTPase [Streptomyces aureus]|uniref:nSTAND1 domain-containing NTPase n=1 Tax=Streptomyces aureus TaxID=193461 RepID=UPI0020B1054C|nr:trypsin-like peptidase domain-containing protein [Streptomyces aureus]
MLGTDGTVAGAGFLVTGDLLATCAHVVRAAGHGPGDRLTVTFPRVDGAERLDGLVLEGPWRNAEAEDVAFVRLDGVPAGAEAVPLGPAGGSRGHRVRSFGFPAQAPRDGHFGFGVAGDVLPAAPGGVELLQLTGANDLTTGFSGGPVLDEETGLVVGMVTEITAPDAYERGQNIAYVTPTRTLRELLPELVESEVCPYRGLESFTAEQARWFEGRQEAVRQVMASLARQRLTLLLGPSGSGKSSLIQAGVLRAVAAGELPGSDRWSIVFVRPRQDLPTEIEHAGLPGAATDGIAAAVDRHLDADRRSDRVLLVVDQFEEVFTQPGADVRGSRRPVADEIAAAARSSDRLSVILIMRDDFYPQLAAQAPELLESAAPGLLNVPSTLSRQDLHDIVTLPAEDVRLRFQAGLPEQLITDVLATAPDGPGAFEVPATVLPLLELTLSQLWERRQDGFLTHEAYRRIGGTTGSLTTWCDTALDALSEEQRPVARQILTSLVRPEDPVRRIPATRAQVPLDELRELAAAPDGKPGEDGAFDEVLAVLTHHRIVTTQIRSAGESPDAPPGRPVAELIHDALIRDWRTLHEWVGQERLFQEWFERTRERRARWANGQDPGDLLAGTALAEGLDWGRQRHLPGDIAAFLAASKQRQHAVIRRSRRLNSVLATLLVLALVAAGGAVWQWRAAVDARETALSRQLAAQSTELITTNPELASLLAVKAYRTSHNAESLESLRNAASLPQHRRLTGHTDTVRTVAFSPEGKTLATVGDDRTMRLWDVDTGKVRVIGKEHTNEVYSAAFSPDGRTLATGDADDTVRLWNTTTGESRAIRDEGAGQVVSVAFSPDGRTLATGGTDTEVRLRDANTGELRRSLAGHTDAVYSLAFSTDSSTLVSGSPDATALMWDVATGGQLRKLDHPGPVYSVVFNRAGTTVAVGGADGTVQLWDTATGEARSTASGNAVASVAFSPDGRTFATGSDNVVQLWDTATGAALTSLFGHTDDVQSVAFSPDGRILASAGLDRTVRLWDTTSGAVRATRAGHPGGVLAVAIDPTGRILADGDAHGYVRLTDMADGKLRAPASRHEGEVYSVAFSPDGDTLASGSWDGKVLLIDVATGETRHVLAEHGGEVHGVAFSPRGDLLASVATDRTVALWDPDTGKLVDVLEQQANGINKVAFSRDGRVLATAGSDAHVRLWDVASARLVATLVGHTSQVTSVAFSPDGHTLASGSSDRTVRLWDLPSGAPRATLLGSTDEVDAVAFSPDGHTLAASGMDLSTRLWDVESREPLITLIGHTDAVFGVAFSPDGRTLATAGLDKNVRLWDTALPEPGEAVASICRTVGRDLTPQERSAYLPGRSAGPVCGSD